MNEPDPYAALERVLKLHKSEQRNLLRLTVWCENEKCSPVRVFEIREGLLVQCRSDANTDVLRQKYKHLDRWAKRPAFFLDTWFPPTESGIEVVDSYLQVVCDCDQTQPRKIDVMKLKAAVSEHSTRRNVPLADLLP